MTEEDFRAAMRELLDEPPRKADFGPLWDAKMAELRARGRDGLGTR